MCRVCRLRAGTLTLSSRSTSCCSTDDRTGTRSDPSCSSNSASTTPPLPTAAPLARAASIFSDVERRWSAGITVSISSGYLIATPLASAPHPGRALPGGRQLAMRLTQSPCGPAAAC